MLNSASHIRVTAAYTTPKWDALKASANAAAVVVPDILLGVDGKSTIIMLPDSISVTTESFAITAETSISQTTKAYQQTSTTWQAFTQTFSLESSDRVDMRAGNAMTVISPLITQQSDMMEVDSTESITWRSSNVSLYSDAYKLNSSSRVDIHVGDATTLTSSTIDVHANAMTLASSYMKQSSDVLEVDSTVSITWRSPNVSLYSDAYTLDSSDTVDVRAGHTMTVSSPRVDVRASMAMTLTSPSVEIVSEDLRIESNQTVWSGAKLDVNVRSTAVTGDLILGNETAKGQLIMLNGKRPNLYETISANGETGDISSGRYHGCSSPSLGTSMKEGCTSHNPFFSFPMVTNK